MWTINDKKIFAGGREAERIFLENELGVRVVLLRFEGYLEEGMETFEYRDTKTAFQFSATRVDREIGRATDTYTVWLGGALRGASITEPDAFLDTQYVRKIARDIRDALTTWHFMGGVAEALGGAEPARKVVFLMNRWSGWNASMEADWP
jgi:hypothetical protein